MAASVSPTDRAGRCARQSLPTQVETLIVALKRDKPHWGARKIRELLLLRVVLSEEEVAQLLEAAPGVKYKAAFSVAYGAGLRVFEVANLKVTDIDRKRMLLRIEQGKGRKDRHAMLSPRLLAIQSDYWWVAKPSTW